MTTVAAGPIPAWCQCFDAHHDHLPILQFSCYRALLPVPLLVLDQGTVLEGADRLSFSAISCRFIKLLSQVTREHGRLHCALGFDRDVVAITRNDTVWLGHGSHLPKSQSYSCGMENDIICTI